MQETLWCRNVRVTLGRPRCNYGNDAGTMNCPRVPPARTVKKTHIAAILSFTRADHFLHEEPNQ